MFTIRTYGKLSSSTLSISSKVQTPETFPGFFVDFLGMGFIVRFHLFREGNQVVSGEGCPLRSFFVVDFPWELT